MKKDNDIQLLTTNGRIDELDFLRAIMIILMVSFHLVWIGDTYSYAKSVVYTFHMPIFLLISGYLTNDRKTLSEFMHRMLWLAIPYVVMESGYIIMASLLPIREHIEELSPAVFFEKLLLHPLGPYWFLHTLILGSIILYISMQLTRINVTSRFIVAGLTCTLCAYLDIASLAMMLYFLAGAMLKKSGLSFVEIFRPSWLSLAAIIPLVLFPDNLHPQTAGGIFIVILTTSFLLAVFRNIKGRLQSFLIFIGRNTLPIFLFSPIFTILCKPIQPTLAFDSTGILFLIISLAICLFGSIGIAKCMDALHISPFFFGQKNIIKAKSKVKGGS